jgi:hypothetical protein
MMMRQIYVVILAGVIGFGPLNTVARAQHFPIEGEIVSASASLAALSPPSTTSATVFTTPASGDFILTEICTSGNLNLSGSTFGTIAALQESGCVAFQPGMALPQREQIICVGFLGESENYCRITGILEAEYSPTREDCHMTNASYRDSCGRRFNTEVRDQTYPIEGKIVSASTTVPGGSTGTVFTTPGSGHFLLTEFCGPPWITNLLGNTFGLIVDGPISSYGQMLPCMAFHPGVALPKREAIICNLGPSNPGVLNSYCSISGIVEEED